MSFRVWITFLNPFLWRSDPLSVPSTGFGPASSPFLAASVETARSAQYPTASTATRRSIPRFTLCPVLDRQILSRVPLLNWPQEIPLAEFDAVLPQERIGHRNMEKEIRQHKIRQIVKTRKLQGRGRKLQLDIPLLRPLQLLRLDGLDEV